MALEFKPITAQTLTPPLLERMEELELLCGLEPFSRDMLWECAAYMETLGAFEGETLAGFVTMGWTSAYCGGSLYIVNLNVAPEYTRRGIARRLLYTKLRELSRSFPGRMVSLDVTRTNPARKLYEKLGFRVIDTPSRNGPEDVVMAVLLEEALERMEGMV